MSETRWGGSVALALLVLGAPALGADRPPDAVEEILVILRERGLIDEEAHQDMLSRHRAQMRGGEGAAGGAESWLHGFEWEGDLRLRWEGSLFDSDSLGTEAQNRYRFRYRARLGFRRPLHERVAVGLRLASGNDNPRSANRTLGDDEDFDPDPIFIDRAYVEVALPALGPLRTELRAGKVANPFRWQVGRDILVWDPDVSPEGAFATARWPLAEHTDLWATVGGFVADENGSSSDPKVLGSQIGARTEIGASAELGGRVSLYEWRSLDPDFIDRAGELGNLPSAFDSEARIGEASAYARLRRRDDWPLLVWGTVVRNFFADAVPLQGVPLGDEDTAWGAGLEIGDARRFARLGAAYFRVEANAVVAQFYDSDLFDGRTNRRGWTLYASRRLTDHTLLSFEFFDGDAIVTSGSGGGNGPFAQSLENADRKRFRADLRFDY